MGIFQCFQTLYRLIDNENNYLQPYIGSFSETAGIPHNLLQKLQNVNCILTRISVLSIAECDIVEVKIMIITWLIVQS